MYEIDNYTNELKKYVDCTNETKLIMQIYLDFGSRLKFDEDFFFGGSKKKKNLYFITPNISFLNDSFKKGKITCKSSAYLLNYILKKFDVDIKVVEDIKDFRKYKHIYNIIKEKSGRTYSIDLQDDLVNIHYGAKTWSFGISIDGKDYAVSLLEQKHLHKELGYINDSYMDDYIDTLKQYTSMFDNFYERIDFVLNNIEYEKYNINYFERRWMHERILRSLFSDKELSQKLHILELFKKDEFDRREYINAFYLKNKNNIDIYMFSKSNSKYIKYSLEDYIRYSVDSNIESRGNIPGYRTMKNKILVKK